MNKGKSLIAVGCLSVFVLGTLLLYALLRPAVQEPGYPVQRQIQYSFTLQNRGGRLLEKAEFWAAAPVKRTATQKCERLETSHPYELIGDARGNQTLYFQLLDLPPFATKIITVKAYFGLSEEPNPLPEARPSDFLGPEMFCEASAPEIMRLAQTLRAKRPADTAQKILEWISSNVKYTGYVRDDRGALHALQHKQGDCTEFMYLFAALCRANGIPARCIGGYIRAEGSVVKPNDYHNWAEFYDGKVWRLADPQRNVFMRESAGYVAIRVIGGEKDNRAARFHRFKYAGQGLTAKMNS
jgi:transglutaminase-like putative cysteine protease